MGHRGWGGYRTLSQEMERKETPGEKKGGVGADASSHLC